MSTNAPLDLLNAQLTNNVSIWTVATHALASLTLLTNAVEVNAQLFKTAFQTLTHTRVIHAEISMSALREFMTVQSISFVLILTMVLASFVRDPLIPNRNVLQDQLESPNVPILRQLVPRITPLKATDALISTSVLEVLARLVKIVLTKLRDSGVPLRTILSRCAIRLLVALDQAVNLLWTLCRLSASVILVLWLI